MASANGKPVFFVNNINIYYQFQQLSYKVRIKPGQTDGTALLLLGFVRHSTDELLLLLLTGAAAAALHE